MTSAFRRNPLIHLAAILWRYSEGRRRGVILYVALSMTAVLVSLTSPLIMARAMNAIQQGGGYAMLQHVALLLGAWILVGFLFWALHGPSRVIETALAFEAKRAFQVDLFHKVVSLPMRWHKEHHSGEIIDQVARATSALGEFGEQSFEVIHLLTRFFGACIVLSLFMPSAGFAVTGATVVVVASILLFDKRLVLQYQELNRRANSIAAAVQDYLTNVATVISLRLEPRVTREIQDRLEKVAPLVKQNSILNELKWATTSRLIDFTQALVILGFLFLALREERAIEVGTVYALIEYLRSIGDSFFQFTGRYGDLVIKSTRVRGVEHIEAAFARDVQKSDRAALPENWKHLDLSGLTFSHQLDSPESSALESSSGGPPVELCHIREVSLTLEKGRSYAFVGESGSGKSTVLGLIRGLHAASSCAVVCDGTAMPFGLAHVAHAATLIPQDPEIFSDSVRFNITLGVSTDEETVRQAIRLARFEQVLERLPRGLETKIGEKGVNLSGGEKQRLALARGLFFVEESGSDIVLLDEPTSSVDILNERIIYEQLLASFRERCVVSAIHKFNLLHLFDEVVVFAGGRVVERGTVAALQARGGEFSRMWRTFAEAERQDAG